MGLLYDSTIGHVTTGKLKPDDDFPQESVHVADRVSMAVTELKVCFMTQCTFNNEHLLLAQYQLKQLLKNVIMNFLLLRRVLSTAVNHRVESLPKSE